MRIVCATLIQIQLLENASLWLPHHHPEDHQKEPVAPLWLPLL
jgi:hypothetical protein